MANETATDKPRQLRRKDARPQELTAAALSLFVERGFAATRLDEIAARAGVTKGTLYLYFKSKEDLFKAVIREGVLPVMDEAQRRYAEYSDDPERLMRELLLGWWELIGSTELGGIPKLMMAEANNFPDVAQFYYDEVMARGREVVSAALRLGIERGVFREVDHEVLVLVLMAPLLHLATWRYSFAPCEPQNLDPERYLQSYLDLIFNGLRARPGTKSK